MRKFVGRIAWTVVTVVTLTGSVAFAGDLAYGKRDYGFVASVPSNWTVYAEREQDSQFIVSFGLPSVWSDIEQQDIENSVSITAYRDGPRSVSELIELEVERTSDILVSREEVESPFGMAFAVVVEIEGLRYRALTTCHFANDVGYVVAFTATEGTFDINVGKYRRFLEDLTFLQPTLEEPDEERGAS